MPIHRLEIEARPDLPDPLGKTLEAQLARSSRARTRKIYHLDLDLDASDARRVLEALVDPVCEVGAIGVLDDAIFAAGQAVQVLTVSFLPGVTDPVGISVKRAAEDALGRALEGHAYSSTMYLVAGLEAG